MKPILFSLGGNPIFAYPVFIGLAFASLIIYLRKYSVEFNHFLVYPILFFFGLVFSKLMFLLSAPDYIQEMMSYRDIFYGGGFVFYGGLIGFLLGLKFLHLLKIIKNLDWEQIVPAILLSHFIGRIGCFFAGCCHGLKVMGTDIPVQLIEAGFLLIMFLLFHFKYKKENHHSLWYLYSYLFMYALARIIIERFRGDHIRGVFQNLSTSQWLSVAILVCLFILRLFPKRVAD